MYWYLSVCYSCFSKTASLQNLLQNVLSLLVEPEDGISDMYNVCLLKLVCSVYKWNVAISFKSFKISSLNLLRTLRKL